MDKATKTKTKIKIKIKNLTLLYQSSRVVNRTIALNELSSINLLNLHIFSGKFVLLI
jgi:hypothetical protein